MAAVVVARRLGYAITLCLIDGEFVAEMALGSMVWCGQNCITLKHVLEPASSRYPGDVFLEFADHGVETALKNTETNLI